VVEIGVCDVCEIGELVVPLARNKKLSLAERETPMKPVLAVTETEVAAPVPLLFLTLYVVLFDAVWMMLPPVPLLFPSIS
jgi:hypothetical protein